MYICTLFVQALVVFKTPHAAGRNSSKRSAMITIQKKNQQTAAGCSVHLGLLGVGLLGAAGHLVRRASGSRRGLLRGGCRCRLLRGRGRGSVSGGLGGGLSGGLGGSLGLLLLGRLRRSWGLREGFCCGWVKRNAADRNNEKSAKPTHVRQRRCASFGTRRKNGHVLQNQVSGVLHAVRQSAPLLSLAKRNTGTYSHKVTL